MKEVIYTISKPAQRIGEHTMYEPMPDRNWEQFDPFLLLHHHGPHEFRPHNQGLPFGPHPHRGFETLTLIYEGEIEHADSQGFASTIKKGGIQWMTAGRGIVHSENIPFHHRENGGKMEIIQLWMNLASKHKMTPPKYIGLQKEEIPTTISADGLVTSQVISGEQNKTQGAVESLSSLKILNVFAQENGKETFNFKENETVVIYVLNGSIKIGKKIINTANMAQLDKKEGDLLIESQSNATFLIASGMPLNEPIVAQGPFVMNSTTEIMQAMRDYQMGKMGVM